LFKHVFITVENSSPLPNENKQLIQKQKTQIYMKWIEMQNYSIILKYVK